MKLKGYILYAGILFIVTTIGAAWFFLRPAEPEGIIETSGLVRGTEITVSSRLAGEIEQLPVEAGQKITKGGLIARLSSEEIEAALEQAAAGVETASHRIHQARESIKGTTAQIRQAEAQLEQAKRDFERYTKLLEKDAATQKAYEDAQTRRTISEAGLAAAKNAREAARATLQTAEAELSVARARVKEMQARLEDTRIHAPAGGTVVEKFVEQGELVSPGTPIATIIDLGDVYAKVYVPEVDIGKIRIGNPARIFTDAFPDRHFTGSIAEISQEAEFTPKEVHVKEERTKFVFGVKVRIDNPQGYLKPGLPVDVKIKWADDVAW